MSTTERVINNLNVAKLLLCHQQMLTSEMCVKIGQAIDSAIDLLKEQGAAEPISYMDGLVQRFTCGKCGKHLLYAKWGRDDFCSKCGQAVKWE